MTDQHIAEPSHWYGRSLLLSNELHAHLTFLRAFAPTGNPTDDLRQFFSSVGMKDTLANATRAGVSPQVLAEEVIRNHRDELMRLERGLSSRWLPAQADPEQVRLYQELLALELAILGRILSNLFEDAPADE